MNHQLAALKVVAAAAFITLIYRLVLFFRESTTGLDFKLWDVQTCTPADYTIAVHITPEMYAAYRSKKVSEGGTAVNFKDYLKRKFESHVQNLPNVLDGARNEKIEIATVSFAHKNGEMIKKLIKRGTAFGNGKYGQVAKMDADIDALATEKAAELGTPVRAFITFCTQEGYERCEKWLFGQDPRYRIEIFGHVATSIHAAPEPTNIIWENQEVTAAS